jgi:hypothetical protein
MVTYCLTLYTLSPTMHLLIKRISVYLNKRMKRMQKDEQLLPSSQLLFNQDYQQNGHLDRAEAKSKVPDWGIKSTLHRTGLRSTLWQRVAHGKRVGVDSGVDIR